MRTIPAVILGWTLVLALAPVLLPGALAVDAVRWTVRRTPFVAVRLVVFGIVYLTAEVVGLVSLAGVWLASGAGRNRRRLVEWTFAVQRRWAQSLFGAVRSVFSLTVSVDGADSLQQTPFLLLARHASIVDNLLPARLVTAVGGTRVHYVLKAELLADPCLDVAGNRLPNAFVHRGTASERDIAAIGRIARIGEGEAVLIYPEGTRFTAEKRERMVDRLSRTNQDLHRLARRFRHVLPPRPGGVLTLLEASAADVVVMAHRGLDGFARVADIWHGGMVGTPVEVAFWRVPRESIPTSRPERTEWLFRLWSDLDEWIAGTPDRKEAG